MLWILYSFWKIFTKIAIFRNFLRFSSMKQPKNDEINFERLKANNTLESSTMPKVMDLAPKNGLVRQKIFLFEKLHVHKTLFQWGESRNKKVRTKSSTPYQFLRNNCCEQSCRSYSLNLNSPNYKQWYYRQILYSTRMLKTVLIRNFQTIKKWERESENQFSTHLWIR